MRPNGQPYPRTMSVPRFDAAALFVLQRATRVCRLFPWRLVRARLRLCALLAGALGGFAAATRADPKPIPVDGYAALVNDQVIMVAEVLRLIQPAERQLRQTLQGESLERKLEEAYTNALNTLIERALILDAYHRQEEFMLPDNAVESRIKEILHARYNNNHTDLQQALDADGSTFEEFRNDIKNRMLIALMREKELKNKVAVAPEAVRALYEQRAAHYRVPEQVELRMIAIHRGQTDEEAALKFRQALEVRKRLLNGEAFDALAKQVSEGPKAETGGYIGWIDPAGRRAELAEALEVMHPGEISDIVDTGEDYYLLKVEGRHTASVIPLATVWEELRAELQQQEEQRQYDAWIERLKRKAFVQIF